MKSAPSIFQSRTTLFIDGSPLLPQLINNITSAAFCAGKDAYQFLADTRESTAEGIQKTLAMLGLSSIRKRNLDDPIEAALAFAAAALLDSTKGMRLTGAEKIDRALDLLDSELSAGW